MIQLLLRIERARGDGPHGHAQRGGRHGPAQAGRRARRGPGHTEQVLDLPRGLIVDLVRRLQHPPRLAGLLAQRGHEPRGHRDHGPHAHAPGRVLDMQTGLLAGLEFTEQKVEVVAYLQPNVTNHQIDTLRSQVEAMPEVNSVNLVTRDEALERFRTSMEAQGREDLTQYLDNNPLYASLEVKLVEPSGVRVVGETLREDSVVRNVINIEDLVDRVLTVTNILRTAGTVVLVVVGVIVLFIIVNTIRLAVVAQAEMKKMMRLVGASDAFIRWPFVFEGAFVGFLGAVVTLGILWAADRIGGFMVEFFRVLPIQFGSLTRDLVALVMGAGVGLGILGSWVSVRTYLIR